MVRQKGETVVARNGAFHVTKKSSAVLLWSTTEPFVPGALLDGTCQTFIYLLPFFNVLTNRKKIHSQ